MKRAVKTKVVKWGVTKRAVKTKVVKWGVTKRAVKTKKSGASRSGPSKRRGVGWHEADRQDEEE
jgi:hypothetical protein